MLVVVFGLPGSGKSFFASHLAEKLGAGYISSDRLRKELFPSPQYSDLEKEKVYDKMMEKVKAMNGSDMVVDGTFYKESIRKRFRNQFEGNRPVYFIEITASENTIRNRLKHARADSDADFSVYEKVKRQWVKPEFDHLVLQSTDSNIDEMTSEAIKYLET